MHILHIIKNLKMLFYLQLNISLFLWLILFIFCQFVPKRKMFTVSKIYIIIIIIIIYLHLHIYIKQIKNKARIPIHTWTLPDSEYTVKRLWCPGRHPDYYTMQECQPLCKQISRQNLESEQEKHQS